MNAYFGFIKPLKVSRQRAHYFRKRDVAYLNTTAFVLETSEQLGWGGGLDGNKGVCNFVINFICN